MKFSGLVVLKYLFQYPKNHFGQPSTFWALDHSIWSKIAKNASISCTLEAIFQDLDFSRTCGFRREFRKGPSFQKIILSGSLSGLNFRQNSIMCQKLHVFVLIEWSGFFPENPAVLRSSVYRGLTSCQKFWKSVRGKYPVYTFGNFDSPQGEKSKLPTVTCSGTWLHFSLPIFDFFNFFGLFDFFDFFGFFDFF